MQKVLVFAGTKQSHKSTSAKYVTASRMKRAGLLRFFEIDDIGDLIVSTTNRMEDGSISEGRGVLDLKRTDYEFARYASENIWPLAKIYSFADELKASCVTVFGCNPQFIYGTDADKNQPTSIKWNNAPLWKLLSKERKDQLKKDGRADDFLTHRELLQEFGTVCRAFDSQCWINACWNKIKEENWPYVIIDDCRYEDEVDVSRQNGANVVLLTHQPFKDTHSSEQIHKVDRAKFIVLDNATMTFDEKNQEIEKILVNLGWTTSELL